MILGLVFSKDRALQLDACLASFFRHVEDASGVQLIVLHSGSTGRFRRQYDVLARCYEGRARFLPEESFRRQVVELLGSESPPAKAVGQQSILTRWRRKIASKSAVPESLTDLVLFLVDDTMFVAPLTLASVHAGLQQNPDAIGFSLRLGRNTTHCYVLNRPQRLPAFERADDGILKYKWTNADGDFAYPIEISSSIYRLPTIAGLISGLRFSDPNTLESQLALRAGGFSRSLSWMLCAERSVAFSAPVNRVQEVFENRAGANPELSTGRLADRFDQGLRIDVSAMDGFVSSACHQEVALSFESGAG
jgi:hypothetical protein